jgi:hypothetical protein
LKLGAILFLSLLPGLLYLQFIAVKLGTLRDEFITHLHRLHIDAYENLPPPPPTSIFYRPDRQPGDPERNVYIRKFEALYGRPGKDSGDNDTISFKTGTLLPLIYTTILLAVGWSLVFQPEVLSAPHLRLGILTLSGRPLLPSEALRFGFFGSYFFILQVLVRRYFQDDLRTSAYIHATVRILIVSLLVTAVHNIWDWSQGQENAFAFIVGVFPQVALQALETLIARPFRKRIPSLHSDYPLSDLDGLNIWYETRLLEEGIEDMQNLATANIVDMMLRTRVPVDRLVDWIDQAHLFLRARGDDGQGESETERKATSSRSRLRRLGVRTATDLQDVFGRELSADKEAVLFEGFLWALNDQNGHKEPSVTACILRALRREPNLWHVMQWKCYTGDLEAARLEPMVPNGLPVEPLVLRNGEAESTPTDPATQTEVPARK